MSTRDDTLRIDKEHPWPWLDAFPESAREFFNGRDDAAQQLLRCVLSAPATVLFGKSGLGKTSLLQAGLSPLLREEQLLPVLVRLTHQEDRAYQPGQLSGRLLARLDEETRACGLRCDRSPLPDDTTTTNAADGTTPAEANAATRLWELLHDTEARWLDAQDEEWAPVFILDQFEEVFTLLHGTEQQQRLFSELGNLIQNRTPTDVAERRKSQDTLRRRLDPERQGARFVLSLREDYLPDLEIHADRIPRLGPNRYRLLPMSHANALEAIDKTGGALVDTADAKRIVEFLDQQNKSTDPSRLRLQRRESIEPALLSLVCAGLNLHRIEHHAPKIDTSSLDKLGGQLLEQFYDRAFATLPEQRRETAARFVETELITLDGTRRPFPEKSLDKVGLHGDDISNLKDQRLLRTENTEHGAYIELVHDRIAAVATVRAQQARKREEEKKGKQRRTLFGWIAAAMLAALSIGLIGMWYQWTAAKTAQNDSEIAGNNLVIVNKTLQDKLAELSSALGRAASAESDAGEKAALAEQRAAEAMVEAKRALKAEARAKAAQADAETQKAKALAATRSATALRVLSDGNDMTAHTRDGGDLRGLLLTMAGHRLAPSSSAYVLSASHSALQRQAQRFAPVLWINDGTSRELSVAFSPDGLNIVSGSDDNTLRLWDARSGAPIGEPLKGHARSVLSVAFSPDGLRIVSGSDDNTLRLWDARSGAPIGEPLKGHARSVFSVAFSPDGLSLVSGSHDHTLRLWDAHSGAPIGEPLKGHSNGVRSVAFSPDGLRIVSGSRDDTLRLWDARSGAPISAPLKGHFGSVNSVAFSSDGSHIVSGSDDKTLRLWDAHSGAPIGEPLKGHSGSVESVAFSPDGSRIVSSSDDNTLRLWDARSGAPIGEPLKGHSNWVRSVAFSPDGLHIVSSSGDGTLRLWDARPGTPISAPLKGHSKMVRSVAFSPDGSRIVSGSDDNTLRLWDARSGGPIGTPLNGARWVTNVTFSADSSRIVSAGNFNDTLRLWDARSGAPIGEPFKWRAGSLSSLAFSPTGTRIVTGDYDGTLHMWDTRSGVSIGEPIKGHSGPIWSVAFSTDSSRIVVGGDDGTLRLWNTRSGTPIGEPIKGHSGPVWSVAFSPDGSRIVSGGVDSTLRLWGVPSGAPIGEPLKRHSAGISNLAFSPDGSRIVSCSWDNTLRLWDAHSGAPIGEPLRGHSGPVTSVAFSPDGSHIVSGSWDNTLRLWPVLEGWADQLCTKLPRNMSHKEWHEWVSPDIDYIVQCPGKPVPAD